MSSALPAEVAAVHDTWRRRGRFVTLCSRSAGGWRRWRAGVGHYPQLEDPAGWATAVLSRLETGAPASRP